MMRRTLFPIIIFIISFPSVHNGKDIEKDQLKVALQKGFANSLKRQFPSILKTLIPQKRGGKQPEDYINPYLNATVITNALNNLKYIVPEKVPLIPFAVAEPIPAYDILFYFAQYNSFFTNLTNFNSEAAVNNTKYNVSIAINLHLNTSSMNGHYELDISNSDIHLFGDGNYSITSNCTDIAIATDIQIFDDYSFLMSFFVMNMTVNSTKFEMENLLNMSSTMSLIELLEESLPEDVSVINDMMFADINTTVVEFTNSYLANMFSWDEIVWLIQNAA